MVRKLHPLPLVVLGLALAPSVGSAKTLERTEKAAPSGQRSFAVVLGNNRSTERSLPRLSFADDDAARYYELFSTLGAQARLLTTLDPSSQRRYRTLAAKTRPPTLRQLALALREIFAAIRRANRRGQRTVFYFIFSGHGDVDREGQGRLHLLDGMLRRADLIRQVIAPSPATVNHVIVDACHAYFAVHHRGGWKPDQSTEPYRDLIERFLRNERIESYPNTGVLLATASSTLTHEWSRIESGLFSHQVRSALAGAADVSNDGQVTYSELSAFVAAANFRVKNRRAQVQLFARPPAQNSQEPVVRIPRRHAYRVRLAASLKGHFLLEDQRGTRFAEFNKSDEAPLVLVLSDQSTTYYLRLGDRREVRLTLDAPPRMLEVTTLAQAREDRTRGALDDDLRRGLFAIPFSQSFYNGYLSKWRRQLDAPLPRLEERAATAAEPAWNVSLSYLLTRPALGRSGLAHGVALSASRSVSRWLRLGLEVAYSDASEPGWHQQRVAVSAWASTRFRLTRWLAFGGGLGAGYLAQLEQVPSSDRGDLAAATFALEAGLHVQATRWLSVNARGRMIMDVLESDGAREASLLPALLAGLRVGF